MPDYARRLDELRRLMAPENLDAYWLLEAANLRYLCGFSGEDSALLVTSDHAALITDSRYVEEAERENCADEVINRRGPIPETVAELCKRHHVRRLGMSAANLSHASYEALREAAPFLAPVALKTGIAEQLRRCKDPEEVQAIRRCVQIAQSALLRIGDEIQPGRSERWVAARLEYEMRTLGADGAAFETICAADQRASMPHAQSTDAELRPDSHILIDWGARRAGYCSDLTRILCMDRIPHPVDDLIEIVLSAQAAVFEKLKPGNRCSEVDAAGRAVIAEAGYADRFGHGIGHGVGLSVHEAPRIGPGSDTALAPGMVVTVEPGIYIPGEAGVRIEDMALITMDGYERLTSLPRIAAELQAAAAPGTANTN